MKIILTILVSLIFFGCDSPEQNESSNAVPNLGSEHKSTVIEGRSEYPVDSAELLRYSRMLVQGEIMSRNLEGLTIDSMTLEETDNPDCLYSVTLILSDDQKVIICWDLYVQSHLKW
jgi:hypothetical protein